MILRDLAYPLMLGLTFAAALAVPLWSALPGHGNLAPQALAALAALAFVLCLVGQDAHRFTPATLRAAAVYGVTWGLLAALPMAAGFGLVRLAGAVLP